MSRLYQFDSEKACAINGELTAETVPEYWDMRGQVLISAKGGSVIDLGCITKIDSAGVAFITTLLLQCRNDDKSMWLANVPLQMKEITEVSELESVLAEFIKS